MSFSQKRKNRSVVPWKGKLYQYVMRDFANVPVLNLKGQKLTDSKGNVKTSKRKEMSYIFEIYSSLCELDEYFIDLYNFQRDAVLKGEIDPARKMLKPTTNTISLKFEKAWKYFLKTYATTAPKGMRAQIKELQRDMGKLDMAIFGLLGKYALQSRDLNDGLGALKLSSKTPVVKRVVEGYVVFLQNVFKTLSISIKTTRKANPRLGLKYLQFELGGEMEALLESSSEAQVEEIKRALTLKELQEKRLEASLLKTGDLIETVPFYFEDGRPPVFLKVAYDPRVVRFPKPKNEAKKIKLTAKERDLILNAGKISNHDFWKIPGASDFDVDDPQALLRPPPSPTTASEEELENHKEFIKLLQSKLDRANELKNNKEIDPKYLKSDGKTPKEYYPATHHLFPGKPKVRYLVSGKARSRYGALSIALTKLIQYQNAPFHKEKYREEMKEWRDSIAPLVKGIYHPDLLTTSGAGYERFDSFDEVAKKADKARKKKAKAEKDLEPTFERVKMTLDDVQTYNPRTGEMEYVQKEIVIQKITLGSGRSSYTPPHFQEQLQSAMSRMANGEAPRSRTIKEGSGMEAMGITRSFSVMKVMINGVEKDLIVKGRYAGYTLDTVVNMEGRFLEGGYIQNGTRKELYEDRIIVNEDGIKTFDMNETGARTSRLIEPYITVDDKGTGLVLGLPSGNESTSDRQLMTDLAKKNSLVTRVVPDGLRGKAAGAFAFYLFPPSEYEMVKETLGSVALSRPASDLLESYYAKLQNIEKSTSEENVVRFTPEALGGFIERLPNNRRFSLNNKQLEAISYLDASGMQGVVALDTGVGKTLTTVASIKNAINQEMVGGLPERRFLFVSPSRLVGNLKKEIKAFMVEGGEEQTLADGTKDTVPNWKEIMLSRVDEMSYDDYLAKFMDVDNKLVSDTEVLELRKSLEENKLRKKNAGKTITLVKEDGVIVDTISGNAVRRTASEESAPVMGPVQTQEVITYPSLSDAEKKAMSAQDRETRKRLRELEKTISIESFPKADKYFQKEYYCCFFDEVNEVLGSRDKNKAMTSLKHPRKVFLTASSIEKDPLDLYKFVMMAKGAEIKKSDLDSFAEQYGNKIGGQFVGMTKDPAKRKEFLRWVKENAYFAIKTDSTYDREYGVDYGRAGLPILRLLQSRTLTVQMDKSTRAEYKETAKEVARELEAMLKKYRDMREHRDVYDDEGDVDFLQTDARGNVIKDRRGRAKLLRDFAKSGLTSQIKKLIKLSNSGTAKQKQATSLFQENPNARFIYFASDPSLLKKVIQANSKKAPLDKVHVLCLDTEMVFYRRGKVLKTISANDNLSLEGFKSQLDAEGLTLKSANEEENQIEATWAIDISKEFIKENQMVATIGCTDAYARGFNFQTFTKVVHLDRGEKFDSELVKQRTARAYRGGQANQVEEIYIDATLTASSETSGVVSESAIFKDGGGGPVKNATSLSRSEIKEGEEYQAYCWVEEKEDWEATGLKFKLQSAPEGETLTSVQANMNEAIERLFNAEGYVLPLRGKRTIVIPANQKPKDRSRVPQGMEAISIDQLKSLVNAADQEFFNEIIKEALATDLTEGISSEVDTGRAITMPKSILRAVVDPTDDNIANLVEETRLMEEEPLRSIALSPTRWEDYPHLSDVIKYNDEVFPEGAIPEEARKYVDLLGGPASLDVMGSNAELKIAPSTYSSGTMSIVVSGAHGSGGISIKHDHIYNGIVSLKPCAPKSYSTRFIFAEVIQAIKMGKKYIKCNAAGSFGDERFCGYAVWPKFGFDGMVKLPTGSLISTQNAWFEAIRQVFPSGSSVSILDLYSLSADIEYKNSKGEVRKQKDAPVGQLWWTQFGRSIDVVLDLTPGSKSMRIVNSYFKRKAQEANLSLEEYLNAPMEPFNVGDPWCWNKQIDKTEIKGRLVSFKELVSLYPKEFKLAWYANYALRNKTKALCGDDATYEAFCAKYKLIDPQNNHISPSPESRATQAIQNWETPTGPSAQYSNVSRRMASEGGGDLGLAHLINDPHLEAIWKEIRAENLERINLLSLEEAEESPDLIETQRLREHKD
jgi:hypothetical protein